MSTSLPNKIRALAHRPSVRRWGTYALRVAAVLGLLGVFSSCAGQVPPLLVALVWAALSCIAALGVAHQAVVRKTYRQGLLKAGGTLSGWNAGRMLAFVVSFAASAWCVASLMFAAPVWNVGKWCVVCAGTVAYAGVYALLDGRLAGELAEPYRLAKATRWSWGIAGVLICVACLVVSVLTAGDAPASAAAAFASAPQSFADSPSALMAQAGKVSALVDGLTSAVLVSVPGVNGLAYTAVRAFLDASALFGVAALFGACSLPSSEIRRVFAPLAPGGEDGAPLPEGARPRRRYVVCACALPALLVAGFLVADAAVAKAAATGEATAAEDFVRGQVDLAVYVLDGKYYERQGVDELLAQAGEQAAQLEESVRSELVPVANAFYDGCLDNVDTYLDWYYSLPADYERLASMVTGTAEDFVSEQLATHLEDGLDDAGLTEKVEGYCAQAAQLRDDFYARLDALQVDGVPDWLVTKDAGLDAGQLLDVLEPANRLLDGEQRLGAAGVTGVAAGVTVGLAAKSLVKNSLEKGFFKKLVEKVAAKLGSKAVGSAAGAAVGAAVGSVAPGVGTAAGAVAGAAVGAAASVGVDYGLLKLDEWQNRDEYRQQIVDAIEQSRSDMLSLLQPTGA